MITKLLTLVGAISLLVPTPAIASWIPVGSTNDGMSVYINDETFSYRNSTVEFWQRYVSPSPNERGVIAKDSYAHMNCSKATLQLNRVVGYNPSGQILFDITKSLPPVVIKAGSLNADIYDYACR